jgi:hypothetical protein
LKGKSAARKLCLNAVARQNRVNNWCKQHKIGGPINGGKSFSQMNAEWDLEVMASFACGIALMNAAMLTDLHG